MDHVSPLTVIVQIINFYILFNFVLKPLLFKPLQTAMAESEAIARKSLDEAEAVTREAKALKADYEKKLKDAHAEAQSIISASQKEGDQMKSQLVEEGRK